MKNNYYKIHEKIKDRIKKQETVISKEFLNYKKECEKGFELIKDDLILIKEELIKIKPEAGSVVFFPSNYIYVHEVMPISNGIRYAIPQWYHSLTTQRDSTGEE